MISECKLLILISFYLFLCNINVVCTLKQPHIIIIIADDMGRNDVGFHGSSQIPTPNIDALGYNGVILNRHYSMHICTPSRAALLTGNFPIRSGMQGWPIKLGEPRALPTNMPTMAEQLLKLGYNTHLVGKWHLGHYNKTATPLGKGFQTFFGYYNGLTGYFDYITSDRNFIHGGFDLHRQFLPAFEDRGKYATELFTGEAINIINNHDQSNPMFLVVAHIAPHTGRNNTMLEVPDPEEAQEKYYYIKEPGRRFYADIVNRMDASIGDLVEALEKKGMLKDSILVFMSDNGGPTVGFTQNYASNWPMRGLKQTLFEGGVRNIAVMWSNRLKKNSYIENTPFHIADWMPTLYNAAGGNVADLGPIDGINHWPMLSEGQPPKQRPDILINIDEQRNFSAILSSDGHYKLTLGYFNNGTFDGYFGDSGRENSPPYNFTSVLNSPVNRAIMATDRSLPPLLTVEVITKLRNELEVPQFNVPRGNLTCTPGYCLFDLEEDPTETTNIAEDKPDVVDILARSLESYRKELVLQINASIDLRSDPIFCNGTWFTWLDSEEKCFLDVKQTMLQSNNASYIYPEIIASILITFIVFIFK